MLVKDIILQIQKEQASINRKIDLILASDLQQSSNIETRGSALGDKYETKIEKLEIADDILDDLYKSIPLSKNDVCLKYKISMPTLNAFLKKCNNTDNLVDYQ